MKIYIVQKKITENFNDCIETITLAVFRQLEGAKKFVEKQKDFNGWDSGSLETKEDKKGNWYSIIPTETKD